MTNPNKFKSYRAYPKKDVHRYWASNGLSPLTIAQLYSFPKLTVTGPTPAIGLIELGGGYSPSQMQTWCTQVGVGMPMLKSISVDGATNSFTNNGNGPDGEVVLDICNAAGIYYYITGNPANIFVIFAPNSDQGFIDAVTAAYQNGCVSCGISWGGPEDQYNTSSITSMDSQFANGFAKGVTYTVAAGDQGSTDGESNNTADYPGSSPYVVCCGGSSLTIVNNIITNEVPWNADGGATGGGYSAVEKIPSWQVGVVTPAGEQFRGVPDLCMLADPSPGWMTPFGPIGGTSAVAPAMAAYFAAIAAVKGKGLGLVNEILYQNEANCFRDIVTGSNTL